MWLKSLAWSLVVNVINLLAFLHQENDWFNKISKDREVLRKVLKGKIKEFDGPINLELSFQEYVNLLFLSKITILLTNFAEGWNRIAHESLICDTPVIGLKGSGGMEELLTMSGQKILDKESLSNIENIINSTINHIDIDKKIIEKLNIDYFNKEWENIVDSIL